MRSIKYSAIQKIGVLVFEGKADFITSICLKKRVNIINVVKFFFNGISIYVLLMHYVPCTREVW